ncbi:MAG: class I SAM-dependent methyltransferase [Gemmatimonadota bacterium]
MVAATCRICNATEVAGRHRVREMMFGLREVFDYLECGACGCLQIAEIPEDISKYYPPDYYAHQPQSARNPVVRYLRRRRNHYGFFRRGLLGQVLSWISPYPRGNVYGWLHRSGASRDSRILEIGCGTGAFLSDLREQGFHRLLGADPFIATDCVLPNGIPLRKATADQLDGSFDLIMLHHTLEHIPDQLSTLRSIAGLLASGGECLIRIPISSSYAWEHYRENWVQIDAPRHFFLHSIDSIRLLGEMAGLRLAEVQYDSTELQFVGSEMYRRDIPLTSARPELFTRRELRQFRKAARRLNEEGRGDSAALFFRVAEEGTGSM